MEKAPMMVKTKTRSNVVASDVIGTGIIRGAAVGFGAMAAGLVGAWSVSCLVAGIIAAGGPLGLVTSWLGAVAGI
ncbi:MAG: hypothetical protein OEV89_06125 [Desulfobulbaceae bacterium]|nr:hypothetical protein [Desulfobulbaceae bacterium]HIJ90329.1 hypothetical protein [Deltaproteobacteria bacterium]